MEPAHSIITALGGPTAVADLVGVHRTRVSMWKCSKERGGTDGLIPMKHAIVLLRIAKERDIEIGPENFFPSEDSGNPATAA